MEVLQDVWPQENWLSGLHVLGRELFVLREVSSPVGLRQGSDLARLCSRN